MGSMNDSFLDATGDRTSPYNLNGKNSLTGIPRRELTNCELRASVSGFRSNTVILAGLTAFGGTIDVGSIMVHRTAKVDDLTLNATPYKAPKDALKAYEKGLAAEKNGKLDNAREYFEKAVAIYPGYAYAWFQLGTVLQAAGQKDPARTAYTRATDIDTKYLPPYLSLAVIEYEAGNWMEVVNLTGHILELDPLNRENAYVVDFDPLNCAEAYFYNAMANYQLNKIEEAEKNALKAEQRADLSRFPQLHLLLAEIYTRKSSYGNAISEVEAYLQLAPHAKDVDHVREQLAKLEKLNRSAPTREKTEQK
jgi:tetratricopeptide (TPR) repeat protein